MGSGRVSKEISGSGSGSGTRWALSVALKLSAQKADGLFLHPKKPTTCERSASKYMGPS